MTVAELNVSRREVLGAACGAALARHPVPGSGPGNPGPLFDSRPPQEGRGIPDQVRNDERWGRALARFRVAEGALAAVQGAEDVVFDPVVGRFNRALARLLRTSAPHVAALAAKLDLLVANQVWELTFAESCLAAMRRDAFRLAGATA